MSPEPNDRLLNAKECAAYLGVHRTTFAEHVAGHLPCVNIGRRRLFKLGDLKAWVDRQRAASRAA